MTDVSVRCDLISRFPDSFSETAERARFRAGFSQSHLREYTRESERTPAELVRDTVHLTRMLSLTDTRANGPIEPIKTS